MKITLTEFESSLLEKVCFNTKANVLAVEFLHSNLMYIYKDVELIEFYNLQEAESLGSYFAKNIRNNYEFEKIEYPIIMESEIDMVDHNKEDK